MAVEGFTTKLAWSQFQNFTTRPAFETEDAQIHSKMGFSNIKLKSKGKSVGIADIDIKLYLVSEECWVVTKEMSNYLLKHEQGHYDILALSARELYKKLLTLSALNTQQLQESVTQLSEKTQERVKKVDERYDQQTNHSRDKAAQQIWDQKIAAEKQKPDGSIDNLP
ncbi:protein of unknown function [Cnuella takakiae]|uniref:DUF922 domain-containing protein n=2 Tax=Cnuella takakiae TaxID=1302690 RepID=A0A1M4S9U4_9BACT|nr:hypothetical protein BUE76_23055 [Cnuella takakiae]SHE28986.1 protein of unknown function [Cnuella takakiae]